MKSFLRIADSTLDILLPCYLMIVSLLLILPDVEDGGRTWFKFDLLPLFFNASANLIIVLPLLLFSIGLGAKHMRLVFSDDLPRGLWAISVLGTVCALLIISIVYFTLRIDAFWLNVPSLTAYIYIRFAVTHGQNEKLTALKFFRFAGQNTRLVVSVIMLYIAVFMTLATGVRFELSNQNSAYLESQLREQTEKFIGTYQRQHVCFGNEVSYQTNLFFQAVVLRQPFDVECADSLSLTEAIETLRQMIELGEDVDFIRLQSFAALIIRFAGKGMDHETAAKFDALFQGSSDRLCTVDNSFCIIRNVPHASGR